MKTFALASVALLGAVACSSSSSSTAAGPTSTPKVVQPAAPGTTVARRLPGHTAWTVTFVDRSRKTTPLHGAVLPSRTLATAIYRPNGAGPFPLIVFAHGSAGHPSKFTKLFSVWADAGFVVAAPAFPLTNSHAADPTAIGDVTNQPADMKYVLDEVLGLDQQRGSRLFGAIDEHHIGAAGLSLGGVTTYAYVFSTCCRDRRITAAEILDGLNPSGTTLDGHVPLLIAHSDTDPVIGYGAATRAYAAAKAPVWFVTLHGASHASQWEDTVTAYDHIAERVTTDFWQATLGGDQQAFTRLQRDAVVPKMMSIQTKPAP